MKIYAAFELKNSYKLMAMFYKYRVTEDGYVYFPIKVK